MHFNGSIDVFTPWNNFLLVIFFPYSSFLCINLNPFYLDWYFSSKFFSTFAFGSPTENANQRLEIKWIKHIFAPLGSAPIHPG
jgi:hypothetical protein